MQKVVVTGCAGFIGFSTTMKLINSGYQVLGIDNFEPYYNISIKKSNVSILLKNKNFSFYEFDLRNLSKKTISLKGFDICIHLAATPGVIPSLKNENHYFDNNLNGTINLVNILSYFGIKKLIFGSSSSVYRNMENCSFKEDINPTIPLSPYGQTKLECETFLRKTYLQNKLNVINLRFFSVYGPYMRPDLAIYKFSKNIINQIPVNIYGDGNSERDYTYINDIVFGIELAMNYLNNNPSTFEIINLGNGNPIKLIYLIRKIEKEIDKEAIINFSPKNKFEMFQTNANLDKARKILNYKPTIKIDDGIRFFMNWFINKKISTI